MKKSLSFLTLAGLLISLVFIGSVYALNLEVSEIEKVPVVISEMDEPAVFDFVIENNGVGENVEIYSLVGVVFEPKGVFYLPHGSTTKEFELSPSESIRAKEGNYAFEYEIKGDSSGIYKNSLVIKFVKLENVFDISPRSIIYGSDKAIVTVRNVNRIYLDDIKFTIKSAFFEGTKIVSLGPFESASLVFPVKENINDLAAGSYVVTTEIEVNNVSAEAKSNVNYVQKESIKEDKEQSGFLIRKTEIVKTNEGNLAVSETTEISKNILTRLFTTFSAEPIITERRGLLVHYTWDDELNPGESSTITIRTNYTLPFILLLLILIGTYSVYVYTRTSVVVKKRCSFVKTSGGQFALKVTLNVKAKKHVDSIEITDRIPMATKLYQKAGMPHGFDEKNNKLSWKIDRLNAGEDRIFSYIIYSNIRIVGRFELPPATAHFVKDGKTNYVHSNRTYFISDIAPRL